MIKKLSPFWRVGLVQALLETVLVGAILILGLLLAMGHVPAYVIQQGLAFLAGNQPRHRTPVLVDTVIQALRCRGHVAHDFFPRLDIQTDFGENVFKGLRSPNGHRLAFGLFVAFGK